MNYPFTNGNNITIEKIKKIFIPNTKITLIHMKNEPQMKKNLEGIIKYVDDAGQIHVGWNNGSSLALIIGIDEFVYNEKVYKGDISGRIL